MVKFGYNNSMNKNKSFFILTFVLAALLAVVFYFSKQEEEENSLFSRPRRTAGAAVKKPATNPMLEQLREQEFLGLGNSPEGAFSATDQSAGITENSERPVPPAAARPGNGITSGTASLMHSGQVPTTRTPRYHATHTPSLYNQAAQNVKEGTSLSPTVYTAAPQRAYQMGGNLAPDASSADQSGKKTGQALFSPYMAALSKDQAAALEKQLKGLSGRVEEAVLRALLPKSKKNMNVEKYLSRTQTAGATASTAQNPFSAVSQQLAQQKNTLMASMNNAFGPQAARETGQVMDAFEQELMHTLSQPTQSTEKKRQQTNQIIRKYNTQLQKLGEKHGLAKMNQERLNKDNQLQQKLAKSYGDDIAGQLGQVMDKYRQKEIDLAQQPGLTPQERYQQFLENQRLRRKEMEQLLLKNGQSLRALQRAEDEDERQTIQQALQDEESGKTTPQVYRPTKEEKDTFSASIQQEQNDKVRIAQDMYGQEGSARIQEIYNQYAQKTQEIMDNPATSRLEKQQQLMTARQETNQALERLQKNPEMKQLRENKQVESTLNQLMQSPEVAKATPEQKAELAAAARPVLQRMYARINEVAENDKLSDAEKQRHIQAIQEEAQRQLAGQ